MQTPQTIVPFVKSQDGLRAELAPADLNLDPLSTDAGNYARHGTDNGIFIDGNDILANDGENLAQIDSVDGGITVKESKIADIATHVASDAIEEYDDSVEDRLNALRSELNQAIQDGDAAVIAQLEREVARLEESDSSLGARIDALRSELSQAISDGDAAVVAQLESEIARLEALIATEKVRVPQILAGDGIAIANGSTPSGDPTQTISVKVSSPGAGLGSDSNGMFVRVKDGGGILRDTYGLSVDKSIIEDAVDDKLRIELGEYVKKVFIGADKKLHVIDRCGEETIYDIDALAKGNVIIDGYVSGSGSFDADGNCRITVTPNISSTPSVWYVGKTNAMDKWGDDENGNPWGSTPEHPFASLSYAINQTNSHTFPGNTIDINIIDGGDYNDVGYGRFNVTSNTNVKAALSNNPSIRCSYEISFGNSVGLTFDGVDFKCSIATTEPINGQTFFRCYGTGTISFVNGCHMVIDNNNFGANVWGFLVLYDNVELELNVRNNKPALYLELENAGTTIADSYCIYFADKSNFSAMNKQSSDPNLVINAPAGTKIVGETIRVDRSGDVSLFNASNVHDGIREKFLIDWNIADDSELSQVRLHKYAYLGIRKNAAKGQALPGSSVGTVADGADYEQADA